MIITGGSEHDSSSEGVEEPPQENGAEEGSDRDGNHASALLTLVQTVERVQNDREGVEHSLEEEGLHTHQTHGQ